MLGPGHPGWDSLSRMPSYAESMTLKQLIDVVAYLKALPVVDLSAAPGHPSHHGQHFGHGK
ncbi:MAG TPA: hypothetical protein VIE36_16515 [Methylomirabilota bacterium]|jgi:hypothetical protein